MSFFAAIHLFLSSLGEIKDFCPMDKLMCIIPLCTIYTFLTIKITKKTVYADSLTNNVICEDILMRCAVNSIFDCAGVLICTPSNQIIEVCKQVAK